LLQGGLAITFEPLGGDECGGKPGRLQSGDEGASDRLVYLDAADIKAIDAAAFDENADSGDVARSFRDHVARCSDMMSPA
jgi:hypothetical protein